MTKADKFWTAAIVLLVVIIITSGLSIWTKYRPEQPIEIALAPPAEWQSEIYVTGAVNSPGLYPLQSQDTIADIIGAAGGSTNGTDLPHLKLYVPGATEGESAQKVDINRAEKWLLQALPGIGETRAQAIIDYRQKNGHFRNTYELTRVEGISTIIYEKIKELVTVGD